MTAKIAIPDSGNKHARKNKSLIQPALGDDFRSGCGVDRTIAAPVRLAYLGG
jgi:hypothetical protein